MTPTEPLEIGVHIDARPEIVFAYFTDPARYVGWMGTDATLECVPGGTYRVWVRQGVEALGEFVEVDAPRRIVFTWGWVGDDLVAPGSTRVEVTLTPDDAGGTDLVLRHLGLPGPDQINHHAQGWDAYLARLARAATGRDPGPDPNA